MECAKVEAEDNYFWFNLVDPNVSLFWLLKMALWLLLGMCELYALVMLERYLYGCMLEGYVFWNNNWIIHM